MILPKIGDLSKPLLKRKLHKILLKVLKTEEVYVDVSTVNLSFLSSLLDSD